MGAVNAAKAEVGIAAQSAEGTGATEPEYALPVFEGLPRPVQSIEQVSVTDVDLMPHYVKTDVHWEADLVVPSHPASLGRFIKFMLPTDTKTGASDPYSHEFTMAGTPEWATLFSRRPGDLYEKFVDGLMTEFSLTFSKDSPLRAGAVFTGKTPSVLASAYTPTTQEKFSSTGEFFRSIGGTLKFDEDTGTEVQHYNIINGTIRVALPCEWEPTCDSITPKHSARGIATFGVALELMWDSWDAYKASYFGGVAGDTVSEDIVFGSLDFLFDCVGSATHSLQVELDKVAFIVSEPPMPDPAGGPFRMSIDGFAIDPVTTEPITITLLNAVSSAY